MSHCLGSVWAKKLGRSSACFHVSSVHIRTTGSLRTLPSLLKRSPFVQLWTVVRSRYRWGQLDKAVSVVRIVLFKKTTTEIVKLLWLLAEWFWADRWMGKCGLVRGWVGEWFG